MLKKGSPIPIFMVGFHRPDLTKITIDALYERTRYPFTLSVMDNGSDEETVDYYMEAKRDGKIDHLFLMGYNTGMYFPRAMPLHCIVGRQDYIITDNDVIPPTFNDGPCWLERTIDTYLTDPHLALFCPSWNSEGSMKQYAYSRDKRILYTEIVTHQFLIHKYEFISKFNYPNNLLPDRKPYHGMAAVNISHIAANNGWRVGVDMDLWVKNIGVCVPDEDGNMGWGYSKKVVDSEDLQPNHRTGCRARGTVPQDDLTCLPLNEGLARHKYRLPADVFIDEWETQKGIIR